MAISGPAGASCQQGPPSNVSAYFPCTMAIWVYCPSSTTGGTDYFFSLTTQPSGKCDFSHHAVSQGGGSSWQIGCNIENNLVGTYDYAGPGNFLPGWTHYCMTFQDNGTGGTFNSGAMQYINGTANPPSFASSTITGFVVSNANSNIWVATGSVSGQLQVAYPAVWSSILTPSQISQLAAKADPRSISPGTLKSFAFLNTASGSFLDSVNGLPWVITGGPYTVVPDPFTLGQPTPRTMPIITNNNGGAAISANGTYCPIQVPGYLPPNPGSGGEYQAQFGSASYAFTAGTTGVGTVVTFQTQGADGVYRPLASPAPITVANSQVYNGTIPAPIGALQLVVSSLVGNGIASASLSGSLPSP
jgi:hypothetical protein